jgi:hypothetical protein
VDTLKVPDDYGLGGFDIWASSPTDVWGINYAYSSQHCIWHYDGANWKNDPAFRPITPASIFGFSPSDIWMGNTDGSIWHYNGTTWSKSVQLELENYYRIVIQGLSGKNSGEVYGIGFAERVEGQGYKSIMVR